MLRSARVGGCVGRCASVTDVAHRVLSPLRRGTLTLVGHGHTRGARVLLCVVCSVGRYHMGDRYGAFMWYPRWSVRRALLVLSVRSVLVADHRFVSAPKGRVVTTRNTWYPRSEQSCDRDPARAPAADDRALSRHRHALWLLPSSCFGAPSWSSDAACSRTEA